MRVGVMKGEVMPLFYSRCRRWCRDFSHTDGGPSSPALRVPADVALRAPFREGQLRPAVGAGAEELLLEPAFADAQLPGLPRRDLPRRQRGGAGHGEELLLDPVLLLHPLLDRDPDGVG